MESGVNLLVYDLTRSGRGFK